MSDRAGVEIDYCAACRGVWLDRGELDKIIERSSAVAPSSLNPRDYSKVSHREYDDDDDYRKDRKYGKKRKGFLEDLFDF